MSRFILIALSIITFSLYSCGPSSIAAFTSEELNLTAEGPLFSGSNTMQVNYSIDYKSIESWASSDNVVSGKITSVELHNRNMELFNQINSVILSVMSENGGMKQIGVLNPIAENATVLKLEIAADQDITDILKEGNITFVADVDLKEDLESNLEYQMVCQFEFELKD